MSVREREREREQARSKQSRGRGGKGLYLSFVQCIDHFHVPIFESAIVESLGRVQVRVSGVRVRNRVSQRPSSTL